MPTALLVSLASDPDPWVRERVAGNRSTPPEVLASLALDPDLAVRQSVAWKSGGTDSRAEDPGLPIRRMDPPAGRRQRQCTGRCGVTSLAANEDDEVRSIIAETYRRRRISLRTLAADPDPRWPNVRPAPVVAGTLSGT